METVATATRERGAAARALVAGLIPGDAYAPTAPSETLGASGLVDETLGH